MNIHRQHRFHRSTTVAVAAAAAFVEAWSGSRSVAGQTYPLVRRFALRAASVAVAASWKSQAWLVLAAEACLSAEEPSVFARKGSG